MHNHETEVPNLAGPQQLTYDLYNDTEDIAEILAGPFRERHSRTKNARQLMETRRGQRTAVQSPIPTRSNTWYGGATRSFHSRPSGHTSGLTFNLKAFTGPQGSTARRRTGSSGESSGNRQTLQRGTYRGSQCGPPPKPPTNAKQPPHPRLSKRPHGTHT